MNPLGVSSRSLPVLIGVSGRSLPLLVLMLSATVQVETLSTLSGYLGPGKLFSPVPAMLFCRLPAQEDLCRCLINSKGISYFRQQS